MTTPSIGKSFSSLLETEGKWMTVLLMAVCLIIPVLGPWAVSGYVTRRLANEQEGKAPVDFNFDDFMDYMLIGLWPFLVSFVSSLVLTPLMLIPMIPIMFIGVFEGNIAFVIVLLLVSLFLYAVVILIYSLFISPMTLRAALMHDFGEGFKMAWNMDFIKKVGGQMILQGIILMIVAIGLMIAGYIALFVGVYFTMATFSYLSHHMQFQLYELYLERGGEKLQVHPKVLGHPPVNHIQELA